MKQVRCGLKRLNHGIRPDDGNFSRTLGTVVSESVEVCGSNLNNNFKDNRSEEDLQKRDMVRKMKAMLW